jgi:predicted PurR-regulated permease PerM
MKRKIVISTVAAFLVGFFLLTPPDLISQLVCGVLAAFLCGVPLAVLGRFAFLKSASASVHTLVCVLVCLIAVLSTQNRGLRTVVGQQRRLYAPAGLSSGASLPEEGTRHDVTDGYDSQSAR